MTWKIIDWGSYALDASLIYYFLTTILKKRNHKKDFIYLVGLILIHIFIGSTLGIGNFKSFIFIFLISIVVYSHLVNMTIFTVIRYSILAYLILGGIELITANTILLIFKMSPKLLYEESIYRILGIIISKSLFYYLTRKFAAKINMHKYFNPKRKKLIIGIGFFNLFIIHMVFTLLEYIDIPSEVDLIRLTILMLGSIIFTLFIYKTAKESIYQDQRELMWDSKEETLNKSDFYIENMKEILNTIKSQSHDLNNYLGTLYGLIYIGKYERAKEYIEKINNEMRDFNTIIDANNPVITSLLNIKLQKSHKKDIDMNINIDLQEEMDIDDIDLSIVIGNLLDNSIEACEKIDDPLKKEININIFLKEGILYIQVNNSKVKDKYEKNQYTTRFTTKEDNQNHGFGLGNVEFVVNKYNGEIDIEDKEDWFIVEIRLPLRDKVLSGEVVSKTSNFAGWI